MMISDKLIERYRTLQAEAPGCLLLMQAKAYETAAFLPVMDEDARAVTAVTGLKLQVGGDPDAPTVLGGFPKSGLDQTIGQLVRAGHSVAVALQDAYPRGLGHPAVPASQVPPTGRERRAARLGPPTSVGTWGRRTSVFRAGALGRLKSPVTTSRMNPVDPGGRGLRPGPGQVDGAETMTR